MVSVHMQSGIIVYKTVFLFRHYLVVGQLDKFMSRATAGTLFLLQFIFFFVTSQSERVSYIILLCK